eukprot:TRINITY_DN2728_c0_g1_i3.p1 TRINITY_DN2728_c0_g1~~TRINITY_DN2728_c0_g1_i3.p1  ORF type:complete len:383 (-),score=97.93 TRINITY_DN2728_c0_g1_i3:256-1356(-)
MQRARKATGGAKAKPATACTAARGQKKQVQQGQKRTMPTEVAKPQRKKQKTTATVEKKLSGEQHLDVKAGFDWDDTVVPEQNLIESDDESEAQDKVEDEAQVEGGDSAEKKKSRRSKKAVKKQREQEIQLKEQEMEKQGPPESADAFDRLLLGSPNSSFLWLKYMAFHLAQAEIQKARDVAERALKTISFREEQEKYNVIVGYINLENIYGTPRSLQEVLDRALQQHDQRRVFEQLAGIYEQSGNLPKAEQIYKLVTKKYGKSAKAWIRYGAFLLKKANNPALNRATLTRALTVLAKRKHVKVITKFAQLEFKHGSPERARTMFEGIVSTYRDGSTCGLFTLTWRRGKDPTLMRSSRGACLSALSH